MATVANGDGGQFAHYLMDAKGNWTQITGFEDEIVSVKVAPDDSLVMLSHKGAPRGHFCACRLQIFLPQKETQQKSI